MKSKQLDLFDFEALDEYRSHLIDYYEEKNNNIKRFLKEKCSFII